jgi:pimeloyl-ACP methyl ester carboxylesterase
MLSTLAPARRRLVLTVVSVVVVALLVGVVALVLHAGRGSAVADQSEPGPVVLVPGYGGDVSDLDPLVAEVRRAGRVAVVFRPTGGGTGDLRVQAKRLGDLVDKAIRDNDARSVDLVGYSAGGVIVRLYVRYDGGASVVRRVLTIGSPHHGTDVAQLAQDAVGSCPKACEQLGTNSDLLRRLDAGDETPAGPVWFTARSTSDTIVTPTDSAELTGAVNVEVQQLCPAARTGHGELPGDPVVLALLHQTIGTAAPAPPTGVSC